MGSKQIRGAQILCAAFLYLKISLKVQIKMLSLAI